MKSKISTVILSLFLLGLDIVHNSSGLNTDIPFWILAACLGIDIVVKIFFFKKKSRWPSGIVYGFLLISVLMMGWNRLLYFEGYFELPEGEEFSGDFIETSNGPLWGIGTVPLHLLRGTWEKDPEESGRKKRSMVSMYFYEGGEPRYGAHLRQGSKAIHDNKLFYPREGEFGGTFVFSLKRFEDTPAETFSFNFPIHSSKTFEFPVFGLEGSVKASFLPGSAERSSELFQPEKLEVLLTYRKEKPVRLKKGDYIVANGRVLTLVDIKRWDGVFVKQVPFPLIPVFESTLTQALRYPPSLN